ncbi:MAG: hypothetical protein CM15mP84_10440 [Cellvibrionales bacterium]|nr:MAG: hypothetical protein CM15mP84_10440 [Cellvibrionales bacterium]
MMLGGDLCQIIAKVLRLWRDKDFIDSPSGRGGSGGHWRRIGLGK